MRLMTPPLPAASRPSKTTTTRSFSSRTHCCSFTSSICSRSSSALYTFFGSFSAIPSVFQRLRRSVLVEALGRPLPGVLGVVGPVRLLLPVALVQDGLVAGDVEQLGDELRFDRFGPALDVSSQLVAEGHDDAPHHGLVLQPEVAACSF